MADELAGLRKQLETFPRDVTESLRSVAWRSSRRVKELAMHILNGRTGGKADRIAAITIVEDSASKTFHVIAEGAANKPANLALWFERGTRFMEAKPFMRPAGDADEERYRSESVSAVNSVADRLAR